MLTWFGCGVISVQPANLKEFVSVDLQSIGGTELLSGIQQPKIFLRCCKYSGVAQVNGQTNYSLSQIFPLLKRNLSVMLVRSPGIAKEYIRGYYHSFYKLEEQR